MDLKLELVGSKLGLSWADIDADMYKVFCLKNGNYYECANLTGSSIVLSLPPYGEGECFVQAFKDNAIIEQSSKRKFVIDTIDVITSISDNNTAEIYYSECQGASGYRLYKNSESGFNGVKNSTTFHISTEYEQGAEYKVKPYSDGNEGIKNVITSSESFKVNQPKFSSTTLYKSYNFNMFLSWNYEGYADGFQIFTENSIFPVYELNDGKAHSVSVNEFKAGTKFIIRAFVNTFNGKIFVAKSKPVAMTLRKYEKPDVSVVISSYSEKSNIVQAIDSVLAQDFANIEVVAVVKNNSRIVDWYTRNYKNVIFVVSDYDGISDSRNLGLQAVNGEYVIFMNADDTIRPDMIRHLYDSIVKNNCDIAFSPFYRVCDGNYEKLCEFPFLEDIPLDVDRYLEIMFTDIYYNCSVWNKLYKTSIVKEHPPVKEMKHENVSWTPEIFSYIDKFCYLKSFYYEWNVKAFLESSDNNNNVSEDEVIEYRKQAIIYMLKNSNPDKNDLLRAIAKRRFEYYANSNPVYLELARLAEKGKLK